MSEPHSRNPRRKRWLAAIAVAAGLWITAGICVPLLVGGERVRRHVERAAGEILGRPVEVDGASLSVWTGPSLELRGLRVGAPAGTETSGAWTGRAEGGAIRLAILPLLRGAVEARSIRARAVSVQRGGREVASGLDLEGRVRLDSSGTVEARGHVEGMVDTPGGRRPLSADASVVYDGKALRVAPSDVTVGILHARVQGAVEGLDGAGPRGRFEGEVRIGATRAAGWVEGSRTEAGPRVTFEFRSPFVDLDEIVSMLRRETAGGVVAAGLIPSARAGSSPGNGAWPEDLSGEGRFEAEGGRLRGIHFGTARLPLRLEGGELSVDGFSCTVHDGLARGGARVTLDDPRLPFRAEVVLAGVTMETLAAEIAPARGHVLRGTGEMRLALEGAAASEPVSSTIRGNARLEVRDGALTSVGLMKQAASFLQMAGGKGIGPDETAFESITATFVLAESRARTDDLQFRSADLHLDGGGTIAFDGGLGLEVRASFSREASRGIVEKTPRLQFRVGSDGRLSVPMKIRGTLEAPLVQIDLERVLEEGLEQELRKRTEKGLLRRLLGR